LEEAVGMGSEGFKNLGKRILNRLCIEKISHLDDFVVESSMLSCCCCSTVSQVFDFLLSVLYFEEDFSSQLRDNDVKGIS